MDIIYEKLEKGVYNFFVNFKDEEMRDYDDITSEIKCALIEFSTELNTPYFIYGSGEYYGPLAEIKKDSDGNEITILRVDKVEFVYTMKGNSEILLDFNFTLVSGHFIFDKIKLKYPVDLSNNFLDSTAKQIKEIIEHLFKQRGKLCVNCVWFHKKGLSGFCDYQYHKNPNKK